MIVLPLVKMHGTLNDFVLLDARDRSLREEYSSLARRACDRRAGIGADGLLVVLPSVVAHARMRIFNSDGSEAEACGNGIRCVARYLCESGDGDRLEIETAAGIVATAVLERGETHMVRADMGIPYVSFPPLPFPDAVSVSVGNPHAVIFAHSFDAIDLLDAAHRLQRDPAFPGGVNVHVVVPRNEHLLDVRHWERGAGLTYACGTGAVACAAAGIVSGRSVSPVDVRVPGGTLRVEWDGHGSALMTGPAARTFETTFPVA